MRILIQQDGSCGVSDGISNVLKAVGHDVTLWDDHRKSAFDIFDETEPDIFFGNRPNRATEKCLQERKNRLLYHSLNCIDYATDTFKYRQGVYKSELACDVVCLGDCDDDIFESYINPVLKNSSGINIKIVGNQLWNVPEYLGTVRHISTLCDLYASSKISIAIYSEQAVFQILASGGMPLTIYPPELIYDFYGFSNASVCVASNPDNFISTIKLLLQPNMEKTRKKYIKFGREVVYQQGTYWHRVSSVFRDQWNMPEEAERIMKIYHDTVQI